MPCHHDSCTCEVEVDRFCSRHCSDHAADMPRADEQCGCGHEECAGTSSY